MALPRVRLSDPARRHRRLSERVEAEVVAALRSGRYVGGPAVERFEGRVARRLGGVGAVGVGSGTAALELALRALGVGPGWRVALPALSFFATAEAVLATGAEAVFVDVEADRPLLDVDAVPPHVHAVVPVHLFGLACRAPSPGPVRVDDASQVLGWAHPLPAPLSALSFYPTKNVGAAGDGGMVVGQDPEALAAVRSLGSHGLLAAHVHARVRGSWGGNSRLDALQAVILDVHLDDLDRRVLARRHHAARIDAAVAEAGLHAVGHDAGSAVHQYVVLADDRDALARHLDAAGVDAAVYYPFPMDAQPAVTGRPADLARSACPRAVRFCRRCLAVPVHDELEPAELERVASALVSFGRAGAA